MKWTSRKFWISVCVICCGAGTLFTGLFGENELFSIIGACMVGIGGVVYNIIEGKLDNDDIANKGISSLNDMLASLTDGENKADQNNFMLFNKEDSNNG